MEYYAADSKLIRAGGQPCVEVSCRYCGERMMIFKGDECNVIVKQGDIIGYAHTLCGTKFGKTDKLTEGTKHTEV